LILKLLPIQQHAVTTSITSSFPGLQLLSYQPYSEHQQSWNFFPVQDLASDFTLVMKAFKFQVRSCLEKSSKIRKEMVVSGQMLLAYIREIQEPFVWYSKLWTDLKYLKRNQDKKNLDEALSTKPWTENSTMLETFDSVYIPELLKFLHDIGLLIWFKDDGLNDIVIIDPVEYFAKPVSLIVRDRCSESENSPTENQITDEYLVDWYRMLEFGLVTKRLAKRLLAGVNESHQEKILRLLVKYALALPLYFPPSSLISSNNVPSHGELNTVYFVPSLTPFNANCYSLTTQDKAGGMGAMVRSLENKTGFINSFVPSVTFYFAFTLNKDFAANAILLSMDDMTQNGFLPLGFYERLVASLFKGLMGREEEIQKRLEKNEFYGFKDCYMVRFLSKNVSFPLRVKNLPEFNMIRIEISAEVDASILNQGELILIHDALFGRIRSIITEQDLTGIFVFTMLPVEPLDDSPLLSLSEVRSVFEDHEKHAESVSYHSVDRRKILSRQLKRNEFLPWLTILATTIHPRKFEFSQVTV
jgi:hypothetical protein